MTFASFKVRIKSFVALAIFAVLFSLIDFKQLIRAFSHLSLGLITLLLLISVALVYVSAIKWQVFASYLGAQVSAIRLFCYYLVGYFVNLLLPSYVGGDVARSFYLGRVTGQHTAAVATILERFTGLLAMLGLALIFMWQVKLVTVEIKVAVMLCAVALAVATAALMSKRMLPWLGKIVTHAGVTSHVERVQQALQATRGAPKLWCKTLALSFLYHSITVVNVLVAGYAVGWRDAPVLDIFVVLPIALLIGALPISPQGLGIQEGAYVYFFTGIGATPEQALGIGLLLRAKSYILAILGGVVWLRVRGEAVSVPPSVSVTP
jgi:hypothetical protein